MPGVTTKRTRVDCVNRRWTTVHGLDVDSKKTACGLAWKPNKRGKVWVPQAAYVGAKNTCRRCCPKGR